MNSAVDALERELARASHVTREAQWHVDDLTRSITDLESQVDQQRRDLATAVTRRDALVKRRDVLMQQLIKVAEVTDPELDSMVIVRRHVGD